MKPSLPAALLLLVVVSQSRGQESTGDVKQLTLPRFSYPTWSPDGDRILYESSVTGNWEIYLMDEGGLTDDGGNILRLTDNSHLDRMPAWSPDGRYIAFISDRDGDFEVFRMRPDGTQVTQLTHNDVAEIHPYWSPDGSRIIYNRRLAGERIYTIRMMAFDGSGDREVLSDGELNSYAQMSPDGQRLVFDKWQDNEETNGEIYVLALETGNLTRLTRNEGIYDGYPTWYPDGERVLYASESEGPFKLFSVRIDGTDRRQVTFGPGHDARADVSSDGRRILFNREVNGAINIHVLDPEG